MTHVTELERDTARRAQKEPSKRWRALWVSPGGWGPVCPRCGSQVHYAGDKLTVWACAVWPTHEIAVEKAGNQAREYEAIFRITGRLPPAFLGAFPLEAE